MDVDQALDRLARDATAAPDLAEVALALARDEYPNLDAEAYLSELAGMAHEASAYVRGDLESRVSGLCRYLFHEMGFHGNVQEYYDPRNSYLNEVLDRRTGIPISLSIMAMAVGERVGLPLAGVGLPGHFIIKAWSDGEEIFIDSFHGGRLLTPGDCETLVHQVTGLSFQATPAALRPIRPRLIVFRMLSNLKAIYLGKEDFERAIRVIERLRRLAPHDPEQLRDLGISLLQAGEPGRAVDPLSRYLSAAPQAQDTKTVQQILDKAMKEVGRWN